MANIRTRLISGFLIVIVVMGTAGFAIAVFHDAAQRVEKRYGDALYLELGLIDKSEALVRAFNEYRTAPTAEREQDYRAARTALNADAAALGTTAAVNGGRTALPGMQGTIDSLVQATDTGSDRVRSRDLTGTVEAYDAANRILLYVHENVAQLILEELRVTQGQRDAAHARSNTVLGIGILLLAAAGIGSAAYAAWLAGRISGPLTRLTAAAREVARGSYDVRLEPWIMRGGDEIASLARSFTSMTDSLRQTVDGLRKATEEAVQARTELERQNTFLEKLNNMFMIREGRIKELKEEIARLGGAVTRKDIDDMDAPSRQDG